MAQEARNRRYAYLAKLHTGDYFSEERMRERGKPYSIFNIVHICREIERERARYAKRGLRSGAGGVLFGPCETSRVRKRR